MIFKPKFLVIFLIAVTFVIYAFNLQNGLFWDDDDWIINNPYVHDFSHLKEIFTHDILSGFGLNSNYYRPLLLLSFAVNYVIGGIKPLGYHLVSNGFHIANGVLIFLILSWVFNSDGRIRIAEGQRPKARFSYAAFLAALLFLIHPLQTEAVTYISGRGDPMSVFFMLLALWLFVKFHLVSCDHTISRNSSEAEPPLGGPLGGSTSKYRGLYLAGSILSMVAAILSRETAVLFPALLMVFLIAFLSRDSFWQSLKKSVIKTIPYWGIAVVYVVLRLTVFNFKNTLNFYSQANDYTQHLSYRLYTFGHALVEYFKLIFAPVGLHMERDLPLKTSILQWPVPLAILIIIAIVLIGVILYKKSLDTSLNAKRYTLHAGLWFFGWSWFFVAIIPVSGIIPINAVMYEHWLYLPLIGLFTLAGFYLTKLLNFQGLTFFKIQGRTLVIIALVGYFSFFTYQSIQRNILWGKPIEFYEDILKYNPNTVRIMNNLGNLYSKKGDIDKAAAMYKRAVSIPGGNLFAQPYYNLGNIYRDQKNIEAAIEQYKKAVEADPTFPFAYQNLAVIYASRGDLAEAALMLEKVKKLKPQDSRVYYNLGLVYLAQNKKDLALDNLKMAFRFSAGDPEVAAEIKRILEQLGR